MEAIFWVVVGIYVGMGPDGHAGGQTDISEAYKNEADCRKVLDAQAAEIARAPKVLASGLECVPIKVTAKVDAPVKPVKPSWPSVPPCKAELGLEPGTNCSKQT